jgi:hypothetical protein
MGSLVIRHLEKLPGVQRPSLSTFELNASRSAVIAITARKQKEG